MAIPRLPNRPQPLWESVQRFGVVTYGVSLFLLAAAVGGASQAGGPPPRQIGPFEAKVTARVRKQIEWPRGSLAARFPPFAPDTIHTSVQLEILSWQQISSGETLLKVGQQVEAFCAGVLPAATGKSVTARLRFRGDTRGVRWEVSSADESPRLDDPEAPVEKMDVCPRW